MSDLVLSCKHLKKSYVDAGGELTVLNDVNFEIAANQSSAILGASGCGKSTLLHLLGGLDSPTSGEVFWQSQLVDQLAESEKCCMRNVHLGFVYQFHHLLPEFTALENVAMPLLIRGLTLTKAKLEAKSFLSDIGLGQRLHHKIGELSGGEKQRVAIARALITKPKCVLADEPTGNLDQDTAAQVLQLMLDLQKTLQTSFIVVTHDLQLARAMQQCYILEHGVLVRKEKL